MDISEPVIDMPFPATGEKGVGTSGVRVKVSLEKVLVKFWNARFVIVSG